MLLAPLVPVLPAASAWVAVTEYAPLAERAGLIVYFKAFDVHVAVPDWLAVPVTDTLIVVESPDNEPHAPPTDVTFTFVENGNETPEPFTCVNDTTGNVLSTITVSLSVVLLVAASVCVADAVNVPS